MSDMSRSNLKRTVLRGDRFFAKNHAEAIEHPWGFNDVIDDVVQDDDFEALMLALANSPTTERRHTLVDSLQVMLEKHIDKFIGIWAEE